MPSLMSQVGRMKGSPPQFGSIKTEDLGDFPGGPVVKNPPSNAGDGGSIPGRGTKIPHAGVGGCS